MNVPVSTSEPPGPFDLGVLGSPGRLVRAARLYAVVLDGSGNPGPHQFIAGLPEGAAVFALAAPGVRFMLHEQGPPSPKPLIANAAPDAAAIDAWYEALLGAPGMPHGDADTEPLAPGDSRAFAARTCVTARQSLWLESAAPILRYPAGGGAEPSPATTRLVLANQIRAEITADNDVLAIDTATLLARSSPAALGEASLPIARRISVALTKREANRRQRWQQTREIDDVRAAHALKGLRDVVLFRPTAPILVARPGQDPLPGVLGVLADAEGFELRTPLHDRMHAPPCSSG